MKFEASGENAHKGLLGRFFVEVQGREVAFPVWATAAGFRFGVGEAFIERNGRRVQLPGTVDPASVAALSSHQAIDCVCEGLDDVRL